MPQAGYHEETKDLSDGARDLHRALESIQEELEAADWYNQRAEACKDKDLRRILEHNRDEEYEHAAMLLEWVRRKNPMFDMPLVEYIFSNKPIADWKMEKDHS